MKSFIIYAFVIFPISLFGQGMNNLWLVGYRGVLDANTSSLRSKIDFQSGNVSIAPANFKMSFWATQANITDASGNLLLSSNGIWITNSNGDTMMNGNGLNPGPFATSNINLGSPLPNGNIILPWPGDSTKYVLFHMIGNYNINGTYSAQELYYSIIDITLDNGLGAVISKNQIAFQDTLSWGIGACKHANGRDWWIVSIKDNSKKLYKILLTPNGISSITTQTFPTYISDLDNACQPVFSPDGKKFAFSTGYVLGGTVFVTSLNYFEFDRCTGVFSNHQKISINDGQLGISSAFSQSSKYLYAATWNHVFQVNTDTFPLAADTVATYDGYYYPFPGFETNFLLMYLAKDNKIYLTSPAAVLDIHQIEYPDSGGVACNVLQHSIHLPCYSFRSVPNHPNYFLGAEIGSMCDTIPIGVSELSENYNTIKIYPNPAKDFFWLDYDLSHTTGNGKLIIYNTLGEAVLQKTIYNYFKTVKLDCSFLPEGIYNILVEQNARKVGSGKFVKL